MFNGEGGDGSRPDGSTKLKAATKRVIVRFADGKVRTFDVSAYVSDSETYGNQTSLEVVNVDNGFTEAFDVRYDTRLRHDLSNFEEFVDQFIVDAYRMALHVI